MSGIGASLTVQTLRWDDASGRIEMIDQRVLPARFDVLAYESAAGVAAAIRSMVVRGAPAIGCAAAYGVALEALRLQQLSSAEFALGIRAAGAQPPHRGEPVLGPGAHAGRPGGRAVAAAAADRRCIAAAGTRHA